MTIFATGSEVEIALAARDAAAGARPSDPRRLGALLRTVRQAERRLPRQRLIGNAPVKIAIEAGIRQGWDRFIGIDGIFIGMTGFGACGTDRAALPAFRHHRRGGGQGGGSAAAQVSAMRRHLDAGWRPCPTTIVAAVRQRRMSPRRIDLNPMRYDALGFFVHPPLVKFSLA